MTQRDVFKCPVAVLALRCLVVPLAGAESGSTTAAEIEPVSTPRRADTIAKEPVLSFLSRKAVIPKYGFPVDVVELDTQRTQQSQEAFEISLQRDLSIAISEFAPTSKLVANKKEWTSYGLKKVAEREWPRRFYTRCATHNVFRQWKEGEPEPTLSCGCRVRTHKYVIPQFGFVTDRDKPKEPRARPAKVFSTRPYFARSLATEPGLIPMPTASPLATVIKASPGLMIVLCEGLPCPIGDTYARWRTNKKLPKIFTRVMEFLSHELKQWAAEADHNGKIRAVSECKFTG